MRTRIQAFIRASLATAPPRAAVEREALALCAWQRARNPAYAAFCGELVPRDLASIPAVPAGLLRELPFCCFPPEQARLAFHTSGTTTGRPGVHRLLDSATYDLASAGWFRACLPDAPRRALALMAPPAAAPHSSLSHMVALLFPDATWLGDAGERFEAAEAWAWLAGQREPVFLAATALALATLLEEPGSCRLAPGSALMTTGGAKGRRLELEPRALVARAADRLGPALRLVGEYGMTELSSQLWTPAALAGSSEAPTPEGPFLPPPWLVPLAVDPADGSPLPAGRAGQLRFVDLANDHSVLAIETMDQGTVLSGGALLLHGRLPGAEPRGCSLTAEDALAAALAARR